METSPVFRLTMERLEEETGIPLVDLYLDGNNWMLKEYSTIGIISFQLGLLAILADMGIHPDLYLGHSLGEIVPAYLAGFQTEADALKSAQVRSRLVSLLDPYCRLDVYSSPPDGGYDYKFKSTDSLPQYVKKVPNELPTEPEVVKSFAMKGKMVAVGCTAKEIEDAIASLNLDQTCVACFNAPRGQTVSGPENQVDDLLGELMKNNESLFVRDLETDNISYHAPYLEVFREFLHAEFGHVKSRPLPPSWRSTSRNDTFGTDYLSSNIIRPVYFQGAIMSLPRGSTVVEIGPASGLLAQIKRTRSDFKLVGIVEKGKPVNIVHRIQDNLEPWISGAGQVKPNYNGTCQTACNGLSFHHRYPDIWGKTTDFRILKWQDFESVLVSAKDATQVSYDLTRKPWCTLRDHCIRGQNLFPATGFVHALWSVAAFNEKTEIVDFRVVTPYVMTPDLEKVVFQVRCVGQYCELWDIDNEICHATGRVQPLSKTARPPKKPLLNGLNGIELVHFYSHTRRLGYEYGPAYQRLDMVSSRHAVLPRRPTDWISYMDTCMHLRLHGESSFGYPVSFKRIIFWSDNLGEADLWVERQSMNTCWNTTISMEECRIEHLPVIRRHLPVHAETFIEYAENDKSVNPDAIAALLIRESHEFRVNTPLTSNELKSIVAKINTYPMATQSQAADAIVFSDVITNADQLLVTVDGETPRFPHVVVARWGRVRLFRCTKIEVHEVVSSWQGAPQSGPFVWVCEGSSGAVASLATEREQFTMSYDVSQSTALRSLPGMEKGMRQNFVQDGEKHGVWVDLMVDNESHFSHHSPHAKLQIQRPGNLESLEWCSIDPREYSVQTNVATLNFRDVMRAMGQLKEKDLSLGLEFSGVDKKTKQRVSLALRRML